MFAKKESQRKQTQAQMHEKEEHDKRRSLNWGKKKQTNMNELKQT